MFRKTALAALCLALSANAAFGAACAGPRAVAALKIASLQQRLMVAGLTCNAGDAYNRFVLAHRAELQRSDDDLKAWFIANGGEAGYDTYKTKMANLAARGPATDRDAFCAVAGRDLRTLAGSSDLQAIAGYESLTAAKACEAPVLAESGPAPVRVARNEARDSEEVVAAGPRATPAIPYAEAPPPRPLPQLAAATREDLAVAPQPVSAGRDEVMAEAPAAERRDHAYAPPRPAARSERYWYYRRLYARPTRYED